MALSWSLTGLTEQFLPEFLRGTGVTHFAAMKMMDIERALLGLKLAFFGHFEDRKYVVGV